MPTFSYVAMDRQGRSVSGARAAANRLEVITRLRAENMVVTSVVEEAAAASRGATDALARWKDRLVLGAIRQGDLMVFTRQLSAMLKAGVSLIDSLLTVSQSVGNKRLAGIVLEVRSEVQRGRTLTESLRRHSAAFDAFFVSVIYAGETSGSLAQNVARLSQYIERR